MKKISLGKMGENFAVKYLKDKGYKILEQNYTNRIGEIDIIAESDEVIVFIEVKTRSSFKFGLPCEAVTLSKQKKIRKIALSYLQYKRKTNMPCRFDVIECFDNEVVHLKDCF